ncbi:hypothetical protein FIBSPDRAFT_847822 [Athelia psychrophila]|uniref:CMP/dCMP-type deaminase domain-containing protein n=1 Tax=Athelia psychrophila TaxID=1759441 RepID=A0A167VUF2_9AGAM|nr:hypothetical protein FIBSPDRAFT_877582 [Fibularhizoctonia sp. CBS 109695]KZP33225.1 hypothetical protein FIBSPDRAFT_847822 [Fibularhizoctonia sp. CBS 109695]
MYFQLGACIVKGGKILSTGFNHQRPHYDGGELAQDRAHGPGKPVSMHAEMHAIFSITGQAPSFKSQVQGNPQRKQAAKTGATRGAQRASC